MTPINFFHRAAKRYSELPAIIDAQGRTIDFATLSARVNAISAAFCELDSAMGSRVGICAGNSAEHIIALLATLAAGKVWVPLNPRNGSPELHDIIKATEPSIVLADADNIDRLSLVEQSPAMQLISLDSQSNTLPGLSSLEQKHHSAPEISLEVQAEDPQAIKFTGGTTGAPKGVMQPYRAWNTNIVTQLHCYGLSPSDRYLVVAPITHGTSTYMLPILAAGGCIVFPRTNKPEDMLDAITEWQISLLFMPPTLFYALVAEQQNLARDLSSLRYAIYGGAPMPAEKIRQAQNVLGPIVATTYGQTEAPQIATFMSPHDLGKPEKINSVGKASLLTEVAILDATGQRLPANDIGEICIRGDLIMTGYWRSPKKSQEVLKNGWLHTGDLGLLDEQGYLFLKGRSREVIITGGFNVYPADVENTLSQHPAVHDCAVVGIDDEKWGEAVNAAIQLKPGHQTEIAEIQAFVKERLGSVKTPKAVHFFEQLPQSSVGKVLKTKVKEKILERLHSGRANEYSGQANE